MNRPAPVRGAAMHGLFAATVALGLAVAGAALAHDGHEASQFVSVGNEPPAELFLDPPLAGPLARGAAIVPYRTRNLRILPVFGAGALDVSPRAGHLHVSVDDLPWRWADAGGNGSVVVNGLPAGPHKILIELALPDHTVIAAESVRFVVPATPAASPGPHAHPAGHQASRTSGYISPTQRTSPWYTRQVHYTFQSPESTT